MKCPKCHKEVEKGSLYCPYCLSEIPWVREFDTVETLMKKKQQNRSSEKKHNSKIIKYFGRRKRKKLKFSKKQLLCLFLCALMLTGFFCYLQLNTFSALYSRAKKQYKQQNYEEAQRIAEDALDKNPENEAANLLLAKSMEKSGDVRSAFLILRPFVQNKTAGAEIYREYVKLLTQAGKTEEVRSVLKSADIEIQNACAEYICETPVANLESGTYTVAQTLELKGNCSKIYYTVDGTTPDRDSMVYTGPVILGEGMTEIKAFGVNDKGIESDIISRKYVIVLSTPKAPRVIPKSGDYNKQTEIKITVPDGCKAYYAFDSEPDLNSTVYEQPISMPAGYHKLNVILVAANGKTSKMTTMEYYLQY